VRPSETHVGPPHCTRSNEKVDRARPAYQQVAFYPFVSSLPVALAGRTIDKSRAREILMRYAPIAVPFLTCADWAYYAAPTLRLSTDAPILYMEYSVRILRTYLLSCLQNTNPNQASNALLETRRLGSLTRISLSLLLYAPDEMPSMYQIVRGGHAATQFTRATPQSPLCIVCIRADVAVRIITHQETCPRTLSVPPWT